MNICKNSINLTKYARLYLIIVFVVFVISGIVCACLLMNVFGFIDSATSYIMGVCVADSMMRMCVAATMMTVIIDLLARGLE